MSSPGDDLMREIDLYKGSPSLSEESTYSEPHSLAVMTSTGFIDLEDQPKTGLTIVVRSTDQVSDATPSTSRPLHFLPINPASKLTESDLLRI
ncbi:hypothetical protein ACOSP7_028345 [Xanthoceras sorbifolium]